MKKIFGILGLLLAICVITAILNQRFLHPLNIENLIRRTALFGIISIGAGFVIITSGIDLSIGSVICLIGCMLPWLLVNQGWPLWAALPILGILAAAIGMAHGLLITKLKLQPFVVTLCGLLMYRGITRGFTADQTQGFVQEYTTFRLLATGRIPVPFIDNFFIPTPCILLIVIAIVTGVFLNYTIYGRYLLALGRNEEAARLSGIDTDKMIILAYVICAFLAGLGGILFVLDVNSAQPVDFGNFYELYAIAAAVLGGCSLRGGEGTIIGIIIGAAVMQTLRNAIILVPQIPSFIEFAVIGGVILAGVIVDELVKRIAARNQAIRQEQALKSKVV